MSEVSRYQINGVIDTSVPVLENIERMANAACTWVSYDNMDGKWSVVINQSGTSVKSFDDSNIIGDITLVTTNLNELYNRVEVSFPHRDIDDALETVAFEIPQADRFPNEQDNILSMQLDLVNEAVQAQAIGMIELKQNRRDKIVTFQSDFSSVGLQPGDVIDITNDNFGWVNKLFRIVSIAESDDEQGITLEITALEYSDDVYNISDIERFSPPEEAIVSAGRLGRMSAPSFEIDQDTGEIFISSITPAEGGLVETVEFWFYIALPGEDIFAVDDSTRAYRLLTTTTPDAGGTYEPNTAVTTVVNSSLNRVLLFKARARNRTAIGPMGDFTAVDLPGLTPLARAGVMISEFYGVVVDPTLYPIMYNTVVNTDVLSNYNLVLSVPFTPRIGGDYLLKIDFSAGTDQGTGAIAGGRGPLMGEGNDFIAVIIIIADASTGVILFDVLSSKNGITGSFTTNIPLELTGLVPGNQYVIQGYVLTMSTPPTNFQFSTVRFNYNWALELYTLGALPQ